MGVVTVFLDKCTNLKDSDGAFNGSDPYVVLDLQKDNWGPMDKKYGKKTSSVKQGEQNPVYNETFTWEGVDDLKNVKLYVKVMDQDIGLDDKLGKCTIELDNLGLSEKATGVERVVDNNLICKDGKIYMQISYKA